MLMIAASPKPGSVLVGSPSGPAVLNTGDNLVLLSDSLGTAAIASVYGQINGDVTLERWLQADSSVRLMAHPFSSAILVDQLNDDVPLDLSTGTSQNLWYFDPLGTGPATVTGMAADAAWSPYSPGGLWNPYQAVRLLKGPGAVTADISGPVNQGDLDLTVTTGSADSFVVIGNPYPAGVKLASPLASATAPGSSMRNAAIWTWDPTKGSAGAFTTIPAAKYPTAKLPVCGALIAMVAPGASATLHFTEDDKSSTGITKTYFKPDGTEIEETITESEPHIDLPSGMQLQIEKKGHYFDGLYVYFNDAATDGADMLDAPKILNPNFNFHTITPGHNPLSIDSRPFETGTYVPLSLLTTERGSFTIKVSDFNLSQGEQVYLEDQYLDQAMMLTDRAAYSFDIDANNASQGPGRFRLRLGNANDAHVDFLSVDLIPNPAGQQVTIRVHAAAEGRAQVRILDLTGKLLRSMEMASASHSQLTIPLTAFVPGVYMVEVTVNGHKQVRQLVKN
jgi:hypothetical protein